MPAIPALPLANNRIQIHSSFKIEGVHRFTLQNDFEKIEVEGEIEYRTLPSHYTFFKGKVIENEVSMNPLLFQSNHYEVYNEDTKSGNFQLLKFDVPSLEVEGELYDVVVIGDRSITVQEITFLLPNFIDIGGERISYLDGTSEFGRHTFEDDKYKLIIDKITGYNETFNEWKDNGGIAFFHTGSLIRKNGQAIKLSEAQEFMKALSTFLSFLNGKLTSPLLLQGVANGNILWTDCTKYAVKSNWNVHIFSWPTNVLDDSIYDVWKMFRKLSENDRDKSFIESSIQWYLEANSDPWRPEAPIILAQTAMELIYNWLVVENNKIILGKDAENITAANKIRLVLSIIKFEINIEDLPGLKDLIENNVQILDLPDAIVEIRNALVHSQLVKREKIGKISLYTKMQVNDVFLLYIEVSLLYILGYKGKYANRLYPQSLMKTEGYSLPWSEF